MDSNQHQTIKEKAFDNKHEEAQQLIQEGLATKPSPSSSPSHEFSFTISLHSSSAPTPDKTKTPPAIAIDLSPADDIFFHGHLLPLHLLSHVPVSPRSSTNSLDSFTLPIRDPIDDQKSDKSCSANNSNRNCNNNINRNHQPDDKESKGTRTKSNKSFSLLGFTRWRKGTYQVAEEDKEKQQQKKKMRFDVSNVLKRYARMVRPLLFFKGRRENLHFHSQPCSFSGNLSFRNKQDLRGRRGEFSAPASIRTSPTNSGLLVATTTLHSSTSESTMEELQAAIQAAIAHCKNSIAVEDKLKC